MNDAENVSYTVESADVYEFIVLLFILILCSLFVSAHFSLRVCLYMYMY